jgi:hypothetical protein
VRVCKGKGEGVGVGQKGLNRRSNICKLEGVQSSQGLVLDRSDRSEHL